ncbi:MAG: MBL fold metallo-hydrolase [Thermoplasmata archaeon]
MKITDRVELIDGTMAHSYVFDSASGIVLFDTGTRGSGKKIVEYFMNRKAKPAYVILTHYHMDHIGGLPGIKSEFNPAVFINEADRKVVTGEVSMPRPQNRLVSMILGLARLTPVSDVRSLKGMNLDEIKILETPGHTPGSTSFIIESEKVIVVGDSLVNRRGRATVSSAFSLDVDLAGKSLEKLRNMKGYKALPGHGDPLDL